MVEEVWEGQSALCPVTVVFCHTRRMTALLIAAAAAVMLGCLLLVSERASPGIAWGLIVAGAVIYVGVRLPQRIRQRRAEDDDLFEGRD